MMLSGVPNFAFAVGYTNASWTLKVDLVCDYLCRVLAHLAAHGHDYCVPEVGDAELEHRPLLDFAAGYVQRSIDAFPRQGSVAPWQLNMSYAADVGELPHRAGRRRHDALRAPGRDGAQPRRRTGSVLSWLENCESDPLGLARERHRAGSARSVSLTRIRSSRRASAVPRQKCRPPAPKAWCSGLRVTSKRSGSS